MRDDAAKALLVIMGISLLLGILVLIGHPIVAGEPYSPGNCFLSNKNGGFYPYIPPRKSAGEAF